nr:reverse transcriptase domain-containing protein [Tanacetum cinerariifolium]
MFKQLHINITLADALILMPKYQKMLKALLSNKQKLQEVANTPLNENCSAVILKKLPKKLRDPGKFLISYGFSALKCKALSDLGAGINLMPLSIWKKFGLPKLISTRMTLELAHRAICTPAGIARDVFVLVAKFTFLADFVIVDYKSDPRAPLILGRPFLRTARALIDVYGEEMILRDEGGNVLSEKLLDLDSTKDLHPPLRVNQLSGSTTYFSYPNPLLEELSDELDLIIFPLKYDDDLQFDVESYLKEIEFILHKDIYSSLKDSIDQNNLANHADIFVDSMPEMFTDEHALDYSSPLIFDEYDDDFLEVESDTENVYDDPFDSKGEKIKESKLLIDKLDLPCDFLPSEYDSFISQDFSRVDAKPSTNNEDKVFNPGFFVRDKMSRDVITIGSTMRISLLYRGEYSQWRERFMNYLEEQTDGEAMINSIQNGDQPLPVIAQVSIAGNAQNAPPTLKDPNNETAKDLWYALERQMRGSEYGEQDRKAAILYEYETFKANEGEEHERMTLESFEHGPLIWPTIEENGVTRTKKYAELSATKKIQADCDMKATNIILQRLQSDIYSLVNHHRVAKDLWEKVQLLMQGTLLTKQERKYKLYDAFDKFTDIKGESLHQFYLRFTQLINDIHIYKMKMEQFQVNTKFLNSLPPKWSKFVTDVKLVEDLHTINFDQLHAYLEQHELYANEVRLMRERNQDPLALIDSGIAVPVFKQGDDPIAAINKMMSFMSTVVTSHFLSTNNQLRNSSNPRQQATIHDGRVIIQPIQGRPNSYAIDPSIAEGPVTRSVITHNAAYQVHDLDMYDSDCDEVSTAKAVLLANLSSYGLNVLSKVPHSNNTHNDMLNKSVQEMPYSEQPHLVNYPENEITSDSNIIPYSQYLLETQNADVQDTNSSAQQDAMILFVFEQLSHQMRGSEYGRQDMKAAILYEYKTFKATEGEQLLDTYLRYLQVINDLKKCGYKKDNYELNYKFLNNLQLEWKQYDPLALVAEKTKVSKRKEKVVASSDSEGSGADDFSELKKITALLAKDFNRRMFYSKPTNNNLRTSSTSQSANKKQEFVKSDDKKVVKKDDEKKQDISKVKCYNCKKEGQLQESK